MWTAPVVSSAAASEPIDLEAAVDHLRAQGLGDEAEISRFISSARAHVESYTGTRLITQTLTLRADEWEDLAALPVAPVQSVSSISYVDTDGATQTLAGSVYDARLYGLEPSIVLKYNQTWPTIRMGSLITVTAVVGYGAASAVPAELLHAIRLVIADMYRYRETVQSGETVAAYPLAATFEALLANHRKFV